MGAYIVSIVKSAPTVCLVTSLAIAFVASFVPANSATAQQDVHAIVCGDHAEIGVQRPQSDSIVTKPDVTLVGTVKQANQLEVYVDGALDSVVPLTMGATTYETTVHLAPGTRTTKVVAIDACQRANATASVIVTYQSSVVESRGGQTPTQVGGGVMIGVAQEPAPAQPESPLQRIFSKPLVNIAKDLDLIPSSTVGQSSSLSQPTRLALVAAGTAIVTFSSALLGIEWLNRTLQLAAVHIGLRQAYASKLVLVTAGLLIVAVAFLL